MRNTINILYFELADRYIQLQIKFVKTEDKIIESIQTKRTQSKWLIAQLCWYSVTTNVVQQFDSLKAYTGHNRRRQINIAGVSERDAWMLQPPSIIPEGKRVAVLLW